MGFITSRVSTEGIIFICVAILILVVIYFISRMIQKNRMNKRFENLHSDVEALHKNTLEYKFNKAKVFAKANPDIMERMNEITPKFHSCNENIDICVSLDEQSKEFVESKQIKKANESLDELESSLSDTKERIRIVTKTLDHILSKETEVREFANAFKERFRNLKTAFHNSRSTYYDSADYFDSRIAEIENEFSGFEQWMRASEFEKAKQDGDKIATQIDALSTELTTTPDLYEKAKVILPQAVAEVQSIVNDMNNQNIDITYLNCDRTLEEAVQNIEVSVSKLNGGQFEEANTLLTSVGDVILKLQDDIVAEKNAYNEIHDGYPKACEKIDAVIEDIREVKTLYANTKDRFGLDDWTHRFELADTQTSDLQEARQLIQKQVDDTQVSSIDLLHYYREFDSDTNEFYRQIQDMKNRLIGANNDEQRAKKQLVKLQLILNEVRLTASMRQLPSVSNQFEADVLEGEKLIQRVQVVLSHSPLDVKSLNTDLQAAIDFVYKLYNSAHNLMGVAVMVENAIVFGNRYRSTYPELDSELTRAEICFQNGEYTRALRIAIQALENLHPGIYEKLIARKDPAIMNQV